MPNFHDIFRLSSVVATLAVVSSGGATASTAVFGRETFFIRVAGTGNYTSTAGIRVRICDIAQGAPQVTSNADTLMPPSAIDYFKVTPGQYLAAISNDSTACTLTITECGD